MNQPQALFIVQNLLNEILIILINKSCLKGKING